jgi:hypothetical protein
MGCCIAAALIASQGLTLSSRVREFLRTHFGFAHFRLSYSFIALIAAAELLLLGALVQFEFDVGKVHAEHLLSLAKAANIFDSAADFPICRGR